MLTEEKYAVKLTLIAPAGTMTPAGTATAPLLLVRLTDSPPLGAAAFSVMVQLSVPAPITDKFAQLSALTAAAAGLAAVPVPLRFTTVDEPVEELLAMVSWPVEAPATVGSNCTLSVAV